MEGTKRREDEEWRRVAHCIDGEKRIDRQTDRQTDRQVRVGSGSGGGGGGSKASVSEKLNNS